MDKNDQFLIQKRHKRLLKSKLDISLKLVFGEYKSHKGGTQCHTTSTCRQT